MSAIESRFAAADLEASAKELEQAVGLPAEFYTAGWVYEREKQAIFRRQWLYVGRELDIPRPGDYFGVTVVDEPLIVVRDEQGEINAFSAVCRHRSMVIAEGKGHCEKLFVCPYHSWSFDFQGALKGVPGMDGRGIDKSELGLPRYRVETWKGFIFVNFDDDAPSLLPQLERVAPLVERYEMERYVEAQPWSAEMACNWKTLAENNSECYHCSHLHRDTHKCAPTRNVLPGTTDPDGSPVTVVRARSSHQDAAFNPTWKPLLPVIDTLAEDERNHFTWIQILPTFLVSLAHDNAHYFAYYPTGPESIAMRSGWLFPESTAALPDFEERAAQTIAATDGLVEEDTFVNLGVQKGRRSHFANRGPYAGLDEGVAALHRWLIGCYERDGLLAAR